MSKLILILFLLFSSFSYAQSNEMKMQGKIVDSTNVGIKNLMLMAVRTRDSLMLAYVRTDDNGNFKLRGFEADTFQLVASKKGYNDRLVLILGSKTNNDLDIGNIIMTQGAKILDEVIIFANKSPMFFKGDTLMYVADSFKLKDGAVVEDLLKKLPGVQVQKDGKIKVNGKDVDKVLVDGDEFFGSDAKMATQNLEAKSIENIAVYEEGNAGDNGDKQQVLDLRLKDSAKKGYFGKADVGTDFAKFHNAKLTFNRFNGQQKIGAYVIGSSLPNSTLDWQDNYEMGFDPGFSYDEDANSWESNDTYVGGLGSGLPQALRGGIVFNDQLTKKYKFSASYVFNDTKLIAKKTERTQFLLQDTSYTQNSLQKDESHNQNHSVLIKNEFKLDSLSTLEANISASLNLADKKTNNNLDYLSVTDILERNNIITQTTDDVKQKGQFELKYIRNFKNKRRNLKLDYAITGNEVDNKLDSRSKNDYRTVGNSDSLFRDIRFGVKEVKNVASFSYSEPLSKLFTFTITDKIIFEKSQMKQLNNNLIGQAYVLDSSISSSFKTNRVSNLIKGILKFERKKDMIALGIGYKNLDRKSFDQFKGTDNTLNAGGITPSLTYRRKVSASSQFRFNYELKRDFPSFDQTQRGVNVSDPNNLVQSNLDLKPSLGNNVSFNYNTYSVLNNQYLYASMQGAIIKDAITNIVSYDQFGRSISTYANVDGNQYVSGYVGFGKPFFKKWLNVDFNLNFNNSVGNSITNGLKNKTTNTSAGGGLEISHQTDSITVTIGADYSVNSSKSNFNTTARKPLTTQNYSLGILADLPFFFSVKTDIDYAIRRGLSQGFNREIAIWNVELRNKFSETSQFEVFAKVNDILNQNVEISRDFSPTLIIDSETNIVARYFQIGFTWKFKNKAAAPIKNENNVE